MQNLRPRQRSAAFIKRRTEAQHHPNTALSCSGSHPRARLGNAERHMELWRDRRRAVQGERRLPSRARQRADENDAEPPRSRAAVDERASKSAPPGVLLTPQRTGDLS